MRSPGSSLDSMTPTPNPSSLSPPPSPSPATASTAQQSQWHSSVPYLFVGLSSMLGLITFALLILLCSYWRLSHRIDPADDHVKPMPAVASSPGRGNFLVIMAGNHIPTFLATPVPICESCRGREKAESIDDLRKPKQEIMGFSDHDARTTIININPENQSPV